MKNKVLPFVIVFILSFKLAIAADYYPNGNGNYENTSTWQGGATTPGVSDDITYTYSLTIPASNTISLNADHSINDFDFSNCNTTLITINSGNGGSYKLTINLLKIESDFTLVIENGITLEVNGKTTTNGGTITVKNGGAINFNNDVTLAGAGATFNINEGSIVNMNANLKTSGGVNILNVAGDLTVNSLQSSGGAQQLNIEPGGEIEVTNNATFSGSATFDVQNLGVFNVGNDLKMSGGTSGNVDGNLNVTGNLDIGSRAITGTGSVSAGTITCSAGTNEDCASKIGPAILPIELTYFNAYSTDNNVTLTWQTASEKNNDYFTLERSKDGINYEKIGTVQGAGNSMSAINYNFVDNSPINGISYYRLMQTDYDGAYEVFSPVSVSYLNEGSLKIGPNPATTQLNISLDGEMGNTLVKFYNQTGILVKTINLSENNTSVNLNSFPKGNYMMVISSDTTSITKKVMVQ